MCEYGGGLPSPATVTGAGTQELFAAARRAFYEASRKSAPVRVGFYEGDRVPAIEVHLKQAGIDKTGWGFWVRGQRSDRDDDPGCRAVLLLPRDRGRPRPGVHPVLSAAAQPVKLRMPAM